MTKQEFKDELRLNRGKLSSGRIEDNMDFIYDNASANFVGYMLSAKKLGIDKAANIVDELTNAEQNKLILWLEHKPATIKVGRIEFKVLKIIGER